MKTPEEIKHSLKRCYTIGMPCDGCPYEQYDGCNDMLADDALSYICQLEERISLMMIQMRGDCGCCAYKGRPSYKSPCTECLCGENRPMWEYEGLPDEKKETKDEQNERGQTDHHRSGR